MNSIGSVRALCAVFLALSLSPLAHADPAEEAQTAFATFFPAFVSRNQAQVAAMFAADAQFYGTLSPELVTTPEGVLQYFTAALDRPDVTEAKRAIENDHFEDESNERS